MAPASEEEKSYRRKTVWKQLWGARLPTSSLWESKQHPLGDRVREAVSAQRARLEEEGPSQGGVKGGSATKDGNSLFYAAEDR